MTAAYKGRVVVNVTSSSFTSVSVDPSTPTDGSALATGDYMVLTCVGGVTAAGNWAASGFTFRQGLVQGSRRYAAMDRVRQSGDSSYTVTCPTTNGGQVVLTWFDGNDSAGTPVWGSEYHRTATGTTTTCPGITTTVNDMLVLSIGLEASTTSETDISSLSQGTKRFFQPQTTSPQIHTTVIGELVQTTAGSVSATTITYPNSASNGFGVQVAIPPAAGNASPVAEFSSVRTGMQVAFTDTSTDSDGTIAAWDWDYGDSSTHGTTQNPTHTYSSAGSYTVSLTVTDNDAATNTVSHTVVVPSPVETSSGHVLYDAMARYSDGLTPGAYSALTGQAWDVYSGPDSVTSGLWDSDDDTAAYLHANGDYAAVTYIKARFLWDTVGSTRTADTGTVVVGVTNAIDVLASRKFRAHLVMTPAAVQLSKQTTAGGSLVTIGSQSVTTTKDAYHTLELVLSGTTATVLVDGSQVAQWTDADLADDGTQRQVFWEPYYNNSATAVRARFDQVWADWDVLRTATGTVTASGTASALAVARSGDVYSPRPPVRVVAPKAPIRTYAPRRRA